MGDGGGELHAFVQRTGEKIARIRGPVGELAPAWRPPTDVVTTVRRDPWVRRLAIAAGAIALLVAVLFGVYRVSLGGAASELSAVAASRAS